jgi:hypothetical protein
MRLSAFHEPFSQLVGSREQRIGELQALSDQRGSQSAQECKVKAGQAWTYTLAAAAAAALGGGAVACTAGPTESALVPRQQNHTKP